MRSDTEGEAKQVSEYQLLMGSLACHESHMGCCCLVSVVIECNPGYRTGVFAMLNQETNSLE